MLDIIRSYFKDEKYYLVVFSDGIYIKNYDNILSLDDHEIIISIDSEIYKIKGSKFILSKTVGRELMINGVIESIDKK